MYSRLFATLIAATLVAGCTQKAPQPVVEQPTASEIPAWNDGKDLSEYTAVQTTGALVIDGVLDEADWTNATEAVMRNTLDGAPVPLKSTVKMLWDDEYLYFGYYCEDPDAWATFTNEDDPMWSEEVVEFFIDAEGTGFTYYEHEVNPLNVKVDLFINNAGKRLNARFTGFKDWDFSDALKQGVYVEGDGKNPGTDDKYWTVEIAVPFSDIWQVPSVPPSDGDMWRIGCYRIERGDPSTQDDDFYAAFSPTFNGSFHTPWQFGKVYFKK